MSAPNKARAAFAVHHGREVGFRRPECVTRAVRLISYRRRRTFLLQPGPDSVRHRGRSAVWKYPLPALRLTVCLSSSPQGSSPHRRDGEQIGQPPQPPEGVTHGLSSLVRPSRCSGPRRAEPYRRTGPSDVTLGEVGGACGRVTSRLGVSAGQVGGGRGVVSNCATTTGAGREGSRGAVPTPEGTEQ